MRRAVLLSGVALLGSACATPIGVTHVDSQAMYRPLTSSVLSSDHPSQYSEQLLTRLRLGGRFDEDPELVLANPVSIRHRLAFVVAGPCDVSRSNRSRT